MDCARLLCPWGSPGNTEAGCHFLLQGSIFLTQGSNPHPLHWQAGGFFTAVTLGKPPGKHALGRIWPSLGPGVPAGGMEGHK